MRKPQARPSRLRRFWILSQVAIVFAVVRLLLPWLKLPRLLRWLSPRRISPATYPGTWDTLEATVRRTNALVRRFPVNSRGNCLSRSLVLYYFVTRYGFPVQVHCGVRRVGENLEGHMWLSLQGKPFLERGNPFQKYAITFSFPDTNPASF
jgi:hypothetical protein